MARLQASAALATLPRDTRYRLACLFPRVYFSSGYFSTLERRTGGGRAWARREGGTEGAGRSERGRGCEYVYVGGYDNTVKVSAFM